MKRIVSLLIIGFFYVVVLLACSSQSSPDEEKVVRIGYQKNGPLIILKSLGTLDERLESLGYTVEWKEFQAGPALVEALNAESIDFGRTGNSPPIFAQVSGAPFVTIAAGKSKFEGSGILVPNESEIESVKDLKGKTVGFAKGSSSHYFLAKASEKEGISYSDVDTAFLNPGDARIAFEQGNIDAMVVWDPYTASTELHSNGTMLVNGEGYTTDRDFFIATESFANDHSDIISVIMEEVEASSKWANENHDELVEMLAPILNIEEDSIRMAVERRTYGVDEITEEIIKEQQDIADTFYELNIIPKQINVEETFDLAAKEK